MNTKHQLHEPIDLHADDVEVHLHAGTVLSVDGHGTRIEIESRQGTVWITQPDDATDYVVTEGVRVTTSRPGRIVVQALSDAAVHVNRTGELVAA